MNKYNIKVNGISYEVEVEEVIGEFSSSSSPVAVTKETPTKAQPSPKVEVKKIINAGEKIECPMPGTVLKVNVSPGDNVKTGQVMFILEAMKMQNEIMAPHDAKIIEVNVANGANVNTGDILAVIQ
ncbi:biotin/lipoyl-containing protein [Clostridium sp. CF012]|uniref:biotin/lipoyl-containing protein n=1 Tax=Clostridium sp. CF012 TaxID=2843319 RepID=UPI001C0AE86C|nr:biotin/lipoyl-containing protein [Clostridium sp. CF012]MBU3145869.1 biotin/lipoyl-binding protein [Clostridium sp. CF012]